MVRNFNSSNRSGYELLSAFVHGFNSGSKNSSIVGGAIRDVTKGTYVEIFIGRTVKSLCSLGLFSVAQRGS